MKIRKSFLFVAILAMVPIGISDSAFGDDRDNQKDRARHRERGGRDRQTTSCLTPVSNPTIRTIVAPAILPIKRNCCHTHHGTGFWKQSMIILASLLIWTSNKDCDFQLP